MPLYYFHIEDGQPFPDHEGTDLPNLEAARIEAVRLAGAMLKDSADTFWNGEQWQLRVTEG